MKNVLVISLGSSPAVVTETLWALHRHADEPFPVHELHIVTTVGTRDLGEIACRDADGLVVRGGKLNELYRELGGRAPSVHLHIPSVLRDGDLELVADIRTEDEGVAFGDTITRLVREITEDGEANLHLSIAGGRKTMSYHAGAAMTLYGRSRDKLSHTLVEPEELEQCPEFWWPSPSDTFVAHRSRKAADGLPALFNTRAGEARVVLVDIPFVRLRGHLPDYFFHRDDTYARIVARFNASRQAVPLVINVPEDFISIDGVQVNLTPACLAIMAVLARRKLDGQASTFIDAFTPGAPGSEHHKPFRLYQLYCDRNPTFIRKEREAGGASGVSNSQFANILASQRKVLEPDVIERFGMTRIGGNRVQLNAGAGEIDLIV